jgi:hypothetical protein
MWRQDNQAADGKYYELLSVLVMSSATCCKSLISLMFYEIINQPIGGWIYFLGKSR